MSQEAGYISSRHEVRLSDKDRQSGQSRIPGQSLLSPSSETVRHQLCPVPVLQETVTVETLTSRLNVFQERQEEDAVAREGWRLPTIHTLIIVFHCEEELGAVLEEDKGVLAHLTRYWEGFYPVMLVRLQVRMLHCYTVVMCLCSNREV